MLESEEDQILIVVTWGKRQGEKRGGPHTRSSTRRLQSKLPCCIKFGRKREMEGRDHGGEAAVGIYHHFSVVKGGKGERESERRKQERLKCMRD